jgi:hypothetical protein
MSFYSKQGYNPLITFREREKKMHRKKSLKSQKEKCFPRSAFPTNYQDTGKRSRQRKGERERLHVNENKCIKYNFRFYTVMN